MSSVRVQFIDLPYCAADPGVSKASFQSARLFRMPAMAPDEDMDKNAEEYDMTKVEPDKLNELIDWLDEWVKAYMYNCI